MKDARIVMDTITGCELDAATAEVSRLQDGTAVVQAADRVVVQRCGALELPPRVERIEAFGRLDGHPAQLTLEHRGDGRFDGFWLRESADGTPSRFRERSLLCIGEVVNTAGDLATCAEDRFAPIDLPVPRPVGGDRVVAECRDYHHLDDDGQWRCVGSIVTGLASRKPEDLS